ncbi:MAG: serine/threonine protein kinase [Myxococcales bacterium]|nr:serine/threonine protein kinase [Myxococcales bacterium]
MVCASRLLCSAHPEGEPLASWSDNDSTDGLASAPTLDGTGVPLRQTLRESDPLIGRRLANKYDVLEVIGRGGLGTVYKGVQHPIGREVAIKVIAQHRADDEVLRKRFQREAHAAARLKHPAIVALYDFGEDQGELFMVMEYVEGGELRDHLRKGRGMEPGRVVRIARQVLSGLAHAHQAGLVHRDLKPENIMLSEGPFGGERAQILDFGIVKAIHEDAMPVPDSHETRAGVIMGTPAYLAPEQAYARGVGPHTDQYSMGVVLYEALTGKLPYDRGTEFEIMTAHCVAPYPPMPKAAGVSRALEAVVKRAMAKDPADRFESVKAMADALEHALTAPPDAVPPVDLTEDDRVDSPGALTGPAPTPMEIPSLSTNEHAALLAEPADEPLPLGKVAKMAAAVLVVGAGVVWALLPGSPAPGPAADAAAVVAQPSPTDATPITAPDAGPGPGRLPTEVVGLGGRALDPLAGEPDAARPDASPPDAGPPDAGGKPPKVGKAPPKPRPKRPKVRAVKLDPQTCGAEWQALRAAAAGKSLSRGSGLCRRIAELERRVAGGRCKEPIDGIDTLMSLCE